MHIKYLSGEISLKETYVMGRQTIADTNPRNCFEIESKYDLFTFNVKIKTKKVYEKEFQNPSIFLMISSYLLLSRILKVDRPNWNNKTGIKHFHLLF